VPPTCLRRRASSKVHQSFYCSAPALPPTCGCGDIDPLHSLSFTIPRPQLSLLSSLNMLKTLVPRTSRSLLSTKAPQFGPANLRTAPSFQIFSQNQQRSRGYASEASEYDVLFIGGGVAGYVGAIKAGQEGLKVRMGFLRTLFPVS